MQVGLSKLLNVFWANKLTENKEKAQAFLETFFPEMDEPHEGQSTQTPLELP